MANLINGKKLAHAIRQRLPARIQKLTRRPGLGVILVGNNKASELYVKLKQRAAHEAGIRFTLERFLPNAPEMKLTARIDSWNNDPEIDAILVQLPLPASLHEQIIIERINPEKDVDGFHPVNTGRYISSERTDPPVLVEGILHLLAATGVTLAGMHAALIARRSVFTQCLAHGLKLNDVIARTLPTDGTHHNTTIQSDILIVAAGKPGLIVGDDLKPGAIVIDVGINTLPDGTVVGDVETKTVAPIAGWLTPVPGGVGPMTIAMLLENVVRLAERNQAITL